MSDDEQAKLAELDEQLEKFQSQKRWSDVIKTVLAKAELVSDVAEQVSLYAEAGALYLEKSSNQAEAIKCYQQVLERDPQNLEAIERLKELYEKRRDWERLIEVMGQECELLDPSDQALRRLEIAQLGTERLRKPAICIELWQRVLEVEPDNTDALSNLANLYDRAREWAPLAEVLERQAEQVGDQQELAALLQKLGGVYADKLNDDDGALRAYQRLLEIQPDDRRAQEQLKKRYVTLRAWDDLEKFYANTEKWDELIRTFERAAEASDTEQEERIDLLFRSARLWQDQKEKPDRAARAYEKILSLDETNVEATAALTPIYEAAGDARKLVEVYEIRIKQLEDPEEKLQLLREAGLLYEEKLRKADKAFDRFLEAFAIDPTQEVLRDDVARLAPKVKGWERVIEAYATAIDALGGADEVIVLRVILGSMLTEVGRVDDAVVQYRAVCELQPEHVESLQALEALYRDSGKHRELLDVYQRRLDIEADVDERRRLAYAIAGLWEEQLEDADQAIESYRSILVDYGDAEQEAVRALEALYEREGRWQDLAESLEGRIEQGDNDEELAALKFRLGKTNEEHLGDKARAVELYREALSLLPEHEGAQGALEALLPDSELGARAGEILEPIYEERGAWPQLVNALSAMLAAETDLTARLELYVRIGEIHGSRLDDAATAFDVFCKAFREAPEDEALLARLEALALQQDRFAALVQLMDDLARGAQDAALARALWQRAAMLQSEQLGDADGAVALYEKILEREPGDLDALGSIENIYRHAERWRDLLSVLRRRSEHLSDTDGQIELISQMAFIHQEMLTEPLEAVARYREILQIDPANELALQALEQLFEQQEEWGELADNLERQLELADDPDKQIALMLRLAALRETRMSSVDAAIETYREVLEREPSNEAAIAALERLFEAPEHQLQIAEILEPLYRDANEVEKLIGVHETQIRRSESREQRIQLLHRIAELQERELGDAQAAFASHARALAEDPASTESQDEIVRVAALADAWAALVEVFEKELAKIEDASLSAALHYKAAEVREEQLGDEPGAIGHYQKVLELDTGRRDAADALERLYERAGRYDDLARIGLTKAAMMDVPEERREQYFRSAQIYEEILERPQDAASVYLQALELDPDDLGAIDKLIAIYLRLEQWQELLGIYTRKADIVVDPDEKKALYAEVGAVYERELNQPERAIETYQRVLEIDPDDLAALGRLDSLYQATAEWQELLVVLERQADLVSDPSEAISYRFRVGQLWEQRLNDAARAVECFREILEEAPDHAPTLEALEAMVQNQREAMAAAVALEQAYRQQGDWAKLAAAMETQTKYEQDALRRVELLHQVAELHETHLGNLQGAFAAYATALPADCENTLTIDALDRLAGMLDAWQDLASLYDKEIERLREAGAEALTDMALRAAQLYEVQVADVDAAIDRYRVVVEFDPSHTQAIESLDRLYEASERWQELAEVLQREIEIGAGSEDALELQFRLAQVYERRLGKVEEALDIYRAVLDADPEHERTLAALEELFQQNVEPLAIGELLAPVYRMQESWDKLIGVQEVSLRYQNDVAERVATMQQLAEIAEEKGGRDDTAFLWMQRAILEDPSQENCLLEAERLASTLGAWPVLANTYADVLATTGENVKGSSAVAGVGLRLARIYEEELQDVERAEQTYRYILGVDGVDADVLEALERIYSEHAANEGLAEVLRRRTAITSDTDELIELNYRLAQILEHDLARHEEAVQVYERIVSELDPQHEDSVHALQSIFAQTADWTRLYQAFERELEIVGGDAAKAEILARMARLASDRQGDTARAITLWRNVLELIGEDAEALNALGNIYAAQDNWTDLVDVLDREAAVADDDEMRKRIYKDLGRVWYEKLERPRNAIESWERVADLDPNDVEALFDIAKAHRVGDAHSELVDTLNRIVEVGTATLEESALEQVYMELGALYAAQLQQPAEAVESYEKVLELNPRNLAAMDALDAIHEQEANWDAWIHVNERRVEALEAAEDKVRVLLAIAGAWEEKLENVEGGISALTRVLDVDPLHDGAFKKLETLHREASRFEDLIELYLTRVEGSQDVPERTRLLRQVATVYEKDLSDKDRAFDALQLAWSEDFTDTASADALERAAGLTQRWAEVLTTANEALGALGDDQVEIKIALCLRCAKWYGKEGHPEYAIPYLQQVLAFDPVNVPAMAQMAELYRQTQQWDVYGQLLGKLVEMTEDLEEKAGFYVKLGELSERHLGMQEQAIDHLNNALAAVSNHPGALQALERIYQAREQWPELLDVLERRIGVLEDPDEQLEGRLRIAEVYEEHLGEADEAIRNFREVLDQDPTHRQALKGLERLYASGEQWQGLLEILERELELADTERDRISFLTRIASIQEEQFIKLQAASERLEQVVDIDPAHTESLQGLERLYRKMQRWDDLIQTYERHVAATPEREEKLELFRHIAEVYEKEHKDLDQAIDAYLRILALDEEHVPTLFAVARLYEKQGDHAQAVDVLGKLSGLVKEAEQRIEMHYRRGHILDEQLGDRAAALKDFQAALDVDDKHLPSLEAMQRIYVDRSDWVAAARTLEQACAAVENERRGAELRVELGRIYEDKLEEHGKAIACFEQARALDPDNEDAALPLVDEYVKQERWQEAESLLQMLVRRSASRDVSEQHRLWCSLATCQEKLGADDKAIKAWTEAFNLDANHLPGLQSLAASFYRTKDWDKAFKHYQMVLVHHRDSLTSEETTDTFYRLGVIKREQGEQRKALNMFDKALEEDGYHRPTLEALIDIYVKQKDFDQVVQLKKTLLEVVGDEERAEMLEEIGDIWKDKLSNPAKAGEAYADAALLRENDHRILHKLLVLYQSTKQWERAIEIIEQISALEERQSVKAKYAYTVGVIYRDELKDPETAIDKFNQALDLDAQGQLKAFESINRLLTQRKDWKLLERAYRKMLHRVAGKGDTDLEYNLWHALGVIYRDRQRNFEAAAEAFKMAAQVKPESEQEHQILAEIYSSLPNRLDDAISEHQWLLARDPYRVDSYRQLYKLYFDARAYDKAWCLAATLNFLKKADGEQQQFFEQYRDRSPIRPRTSLNNELWVKHLLHPDEDFLVGKLFESVTPAVLRLKQRPDKALQLARKDMVDFSNTSVTFARTFQFVAQVLGLPFTPRLFLRKEQPGGLAYAPTAPPASVCGSTLLSGPTPSDLMFVCGKHLTLYRGEHYVRTLFQAKDELKLVLMAAMRIAGVDIADPAVDQWAQQIRAQMQPADLELLNGVGKRFLSQGARTDIKRWMLAVEMTSARAGFLLCNDLEAAAKLLAAEPPNSTVDLPPKEKVKELVLFSVSEPYFALREALGIGINIG